MKKFLLLFLISVGVATGFSQSLTNQQIVEDILESAGEELSDDTDIQEILDDLENFRQNPLQVNLAKAAELSKLHFLSEMQINSLIDFRNKTGTIFSIYELASVDGFSPEVLEKLEPFISFETASVLPVRKRSSDELLIRGGRSFPAPEDLDKYEGTPEKYYLRYRHVSNDFSFGAVGEKDAGEAFFSGSNKSGFDFYSAFANFRIGKKENHLFVGDYRLAFGQGLVAWQGFSMGKSVETTQVFRSGRGITSYSSSGENLFCRGLGAKLKFSNFSFEPFFSFLKVDASVDSVDGKPFFGALQTSGYHRTKTEIANEKSVQQIMGGGHFTYTKSQWSFGLTGIYNHFNMPLIRDNEPYNWFLPGGREHFAGSFDWKGTLGKIFLFGEAALSKNSGKALLAGLLTKPSGNSEISLVYRNINKTYFSFFCNAFTESSRANDEHGLYLGTSLYFAPKWSLTGYADFFRFRWLKYTTAAPSDGTEFLAQVNYNPSRRTTFYLRFFQEEKGLKITTPEVRYNDDQLINRVRLNLVRNLSEKVVLRSRAEYTFYRKQSSERGFLLFQDVVFKPVEKPFSMNARVALYRTDGYNSRLYAYENDVLYSFSVPPLYGKGIRGYLNLQRTFGDRLTVWLKGAITRNLEQADAGKNRGELKVEIRYEL